MNGFSEGRRSFLLAALLIVAVYFTVGTTQLSLPGVYMDAVNPDYLVVRILNWSHAEPLAAFVLPGNHLGSRFPILTTLYHGTQQVWLGLPFYALFGTDVLGIRLTHMTFGAGILLSALLLLRGTQAAPLWLAVPLLIALAVDPAFIFAFRTQATTMLAPTAWLFLSLFFIWRVPLLSDARDRRRWVFASGLFYGLSVLGYFIYAFFAPAVVAAVASRIVSKEPSRRNARELGYWLLGVALGTAFYAIGYLRILKNRHGIEGFLTWFNGYREEIGGVLVDQSIADRLQSVSTLAHSALSESFHHAMMFGIVDPAPFARVKIAILLVGPLVLLIATEAGGRSHAFLRLAVGLTASFLLAALIFGKRLGGHHFVLLLPIAYVSLAAGIGAFASRGKAAIATTLPIFVVLAGINLVGIQREFVELERTGGVGLFSDAIDRFGHDLKAAPRKPLVYTPDWGFALQLVMITAGDVPISADAPVARIREELCAGRMVKVIAAGNNNEKRFSKWSDQFGAPLGDVARYRQRNGPVVFEVATFEPQSNSCVASSP